MRVLIDTNIILDVLNNRGEYLASSFAIWKLCKEERIHGYISALSVPNIIYIMRKELDPERTEELICKMSTIFEILDLKNSDLIHAAKMKLKDFEDAVQMITAQRIRADYIVTRNIRDFTESKTPAVKPEELLEML